MTFIALLIIFLPRKKVTSKEVETDFFADFLPHFSFIFPPQFVFSFFKKFEKEIIGKIIGNFLDYLRNLIEGKKQSIKKVFEKRILFLELLFLLFRKYSLFLVYLP